MTFHLKKRAFALGVAAVITALPGVAADKKTASLNAASMFDKDHPFTQTYFKFGELVNKYQDEVNFELKVSLNKALGIEPDFLRFMSQGESVDLAIIAPANLAQRVPDIAVVDMPLMFKDLAHRNRVLASDAFKDIEAERHQARQHPGHRLRRWRQPQPDLQLPHQGHERPEGLPPPGPGGPHLGQGVQRGHGDTLGDCL